jgi:hypothetical protein
MRWCSWDRRSVRRLFAWAGLSAAGAGGLSGCAYPDDCRDERMCFPPPKAPSPSRCDGLEPSAGPVVDECGVFVRVQGEDAPDRGTRDAPFKTLQYAIGQAQSRTLHHVFACGERFNETVTLTSGIHVWGGRTCADGEWAFGGDLTTLAPEPAGLPLRVIANEDATSAIFGVRVVAADASASDGKSSIAVILSPGARAKVLLSEVHAGNAKDGEPGEDAPIDGARHGEYGKKGVDACEVEDATGAPAVVSACEDAGEESVGGQGGDGMLETGGDGASGKPWPDVNLTGSGQGGRGAGSRKCEAGATGAHGSDGDRGGGALGLGTLDMNGWVGNRGFDGSKGKPGQGGGGGGGSRSRIGGDACPLGEPQAGAAGGSGGSGGCGGKGGQGGGYGGSSLGIVVLEGARIMMEATLIVTGDGGNAGVGGTGQDGGTGAPGGYGGKYLGHLAWNACDGGDGGNGGSGGDAGGGLGGHSVCVAVAGTFLDLQGGFECRSGAAGKGGAGGNSAMEAGQGQDGVSDEWEVFPLVEEPIR